MEWDWAFVVKILPTLGQGVIVTIQATMMGIVLALVIGLVLAIMRRSHNRAVSHGSAFFVEFIRGTPLLVQLYFLFYILPDAGLLLSPLTAGVIGLGLHYSAYLAEVYRTGIDNIPRGQWEAAKAVNLSTRQTWVEIIIPQAIPPMIRRSPTTSWRCSRRRRCWRRSRCSS